MSPRRTNRRSPRNGEQDVYRRLLQTSVQARLALLHRMDPTLLSWSLAHRTERGRPLDFEAFPFQRELYDAFGDRSLPQVDVMKSAQCGISAAGVSLALYAAERWNANVLYVLPTEALAETFSDTRVRRPIADSLYLSGRIADTDSKGLKRLGDAYIHFAGSGSEAQALSVDADLLVLDEFDRLEMAQVPLFERRLNSPTSLRLIRRFSNPSFPEAGIHQAYLESDQRRWLITCPGCGYEAPIFYDEIGGSHHVREQDPARVCGGCHLELSPGAIAAGRWVPERPGAEHRGYHVSRLIVPGDPTADLVRKHAQRAEQEITAHYNFDLGLPYSPKGGSLDVEVLNACRRDWDCQPEYHGSQWVTAGVDVGSVLHVRISAWNDQGAVPLYIGEIPDFETLELLWNTYNVNFGLIDERPEERAARAFTTRFPGRAYLVRWSGEEQRDDFEVDKGRRLVIARRTWSCDKTVAAFTDQTRMLPRELPKGYVSQLTAPHRVVETTKGGQKVGRYVNERADHYFFAETYDLLARQARGGGPVTSVTIQGPTFRDEVMARRRRLPRYL